METGCVLGEGQRAAHIIWGELQDLEILSEKQFFLSVSVGLRGACVASPPPAFFLRAPSEQRRKACGLCFGRVPKRAQAS